MRGMIEACLCVALSAMAPAATKPHAVALGRFTTVKLLIADDESAPRDLRVRPLLVDGQVKEFTTGAIHDVTERSFVVQRAYRINDLLPQETGPSRWRWQLGGWVLVDRAAGKVQPIALPLFNPNYSKASWFRDYAGYVGFSEDGQNIFAVVVQLGRRKLLLKKSLQVAADESTLNSLRGPEWSRSPAQVTFNLPGQQKLKFAIKNQALDLVTEDEGSGEN